MGFDDIEKRIAHWDARDKAAAQRQLNDLKDAKIELWYCQRGRDCDGRPHEGFDYKHARGDQWPPLGENWDVWFLMCGRGTGKTRAGSNWVRAVAKKVSRIALVGRRGPDVRQTMIEGPSGLIQACERAGETYDWKPALREFTFQNGAKAYGYSAEEPATLRGPEQGAAWLDEPSHMDAIEEVWSNLGLGLREPGLPGGAKVLLTSTPLPNPWTKERVADPYTVLVRVPTSRNLENLDESYRRRNIDPMQGTRIGRQELDAEILEDVEGALWNLGMIRRSTLSYEDMDRIVIAIDPAGTSNKRSDLTGIVAVGKKDQKGYVLADQSGQYSPDAWAKTAMRMYDGLKADAIIVETNFGGDMVRRNLTASGFNGRVVEARAVRGKQTRAEPIVNLYEQGRIDHVDMFEKLELEMTTWVPGTGPSPNRVDAMVWGFTELFKHSSGGEVASPRSLPRIPSSDPTTRFGGGRINPIEALRRRQRA